jgi:hypothetical protein
MNPRDDEEDEPADDREPHQQTDQDDRPEAREAETEALADVHVSAEERSGGRPGDGTLERRVAEDREEQEDERGGDPGEERAIDRDLDPAAYLFAGQRLVQPHVRDQRLRDGERDHHDRDHREQVLPVHDVQLEGVTKDLTHGPRAEQARALGRLRDSRVQSAKAPSVGRGRRGSA